MENLRLILLIAGVVFILGIYLVGRQRRRQNSSDLFDSKDDLPEFSATDWDDLDEGVGKVRIVAREKEPEDYIDDFADEPFIDDQQDDVYTEDHASDDESYNELKQNGDLFEHLDDEEYEQTQAESHSDELKQHPVSDIDIIVLYIIANKSEPLTGDKINSVAQANGLEFGRMNIFHRFDEDGQTLFSLANMNEPGYFDPDSIHQLKTSGLTMFMQISNVPNPSDDFDEMLRCAYYVSEMLGASLCNHRRQPISKADAEYYRGIISEKENA